MSTCVLSASARHSRASGNLVFLTTRTNDPRPEIFAIRIVLLDQLHFPFAPPLLDPFLACDGRFHRVVQLLPDQPGDVELRGESVDRMRPMLPRSPDQVTGDSGIQDTMPSMGKQVDDRLPVHADASGQGRDSRLRGNDGRERRRFRGNDKQERIKVAAHRTHASSVTRSTSSMVVSPRSALAMPTSYIVLIPPWRASFSISSMPA